MNNWGVTLRWLGCMASHILFIKDCNKYVKVAVQDVLFLNAAGSYSHLVTTTAEFSLSQNLRQFMLKNEIPNLIRVHRSYLVNIHHIDSFDRAFVYVGAHKIPIGESYRHELMEGIRCI
jgi:DNA-binding LytR/AlgR family response regulator